MPAVQVQKVPSRVATPALSRVTRSVPAGYSVSPIVLVPTDRRVVLSNFFPPVSEPLVVVVALEVSLASLETYPMVHIEAPLPPRFCWGNQHNPAPPS